jgi:hypothetical protein
MLNALFSICNYLQVTLETSPYNFEGEVKIDHANYIDRTEVLPKILVDDIGWDWKDSQFGSFPNKVLSPLYIEVFAGDKVNALRLVTQLVGKPTRGDSGGILLAKTIPYSEFSADGKSIIGTIGKIEFGNLPLPTTRFVSTVDVAELAFNYIISFQDVACILT